MNAGKLPANILRQLLAKIVPDERVLVGPGIGIDAAVIEMGDRLLVAKTDPITFATDRIGWYAVNVNANDIAAMGATPKWFLATILVPPKMPKTKVISLFEETLSACKNLGISLVGGHTEITYELERPIVIGCMIGETEKEKLVTCKGAQVGDEIVLTKGIAVEGTSILAREAREQLKKLGISEKVLKRAAEFLFKPGISVVRDAQTICAVANVTAMHDPTEGGLATGLAEMAEASGLGIEIDLEAVPILPETKTFCQLLGLDCLGLIASGALLATVPEGKSSQVIKALEQEGIHASVIGKMTPPEEGLTMRLRRSRKTLPRFNRDELARFFDKQN